MSQFFLLIELVFKAIGLWDQFSSYTISKRLAEMEVKIQDLPKAIEEAKNASSISEVTSAQSRISNDSN